MSKPKASLQFLVTLDLISTNIHPVWINNTDKLADVISGILWDNRQRLQPALDANQLADTCTEFVGEIETD
jgi:predicted Ser/Thr protein kinase